VPGLGPSFIYDRADRTARFPLNVCNEGACLLDEPLAPLFFNLLAPLPIKLVR
jgi:hypothetical protein